MIVQKQATLEARIGYRFNNPALLTQALTHRSYDAAHNERLEFLGDALLETIISAWLYQQHPQADEGDLTRLRASLVKGTQLADLARKLNLGQYMRLGSGELKSGGIKRASTLANAIEAIIAAVYLDSDFKCCQAFTLTLFADTLAALPDVASLKDPKTQLQELLQSEGMTVPKYEIIAELGPEHDREFHIRASTEHHQVTASGHSRKKAEQQAAQKLLNLYQKSQS